MPEGIDMSKCYCCLSILFLILPLAGVAHARDWIVAPDGSGDAPTIAAAIDSFNWYDDEKIILLDGVYTGEGNRDLTNYGMGIAIISQSGDPMACIIDCQGSADDQHRAISFVEDG